MLKAFHNLRQSPKVSCLPREFTNHVSPGCKDLRGYTEPVEESMIHRTRERIKWQTAFSSPVIHLQKKSYGFRCSCYLFWIQSLSLVTTVDSFKALYSLCLIQGCGFHLWNKVPKFEAQWYSAIPLEILS